tara:strand:- start:53 stop:271 length:219 start_codon:yes stop_codon:yes gene_type:complete
MNNYNKKINFSLFSFLFSILSFFAMLPFRVVFGAFKGAKNSTAVMYDDMKIQELRSRGVTVVDASGKYTNIT